MKIAIILSTLTFCLSAMPSMAQSLTEYERTQLRAEAAAQAEISRSMQERTCALARAHETAKVGDRVIDTAASRIPGARSAYRAGKRIGDTIYHVVKKQRNQ
jgi:hypothetical protein